MKLNRWIYVVSGVIVMLFAGLEYAWSIFSIPVASHFTAWTRAQLSLTFTICMACFCLGGLTAGMLARKIPVKFNLVISACLFLVGFIIASRMQSLMALYIGYGVFAGAASGFAYNTVMGTITRYFPDKPGMVSGILLMGFGMGSFLIGKAYLALTGPGEAFRVSFVVIGILLFLVMLANSFFMRKPTEQEMAAYLPKVNREAGKGHESLGVEMTASQMLRRRSFWFYALWAVLLSMAGLALISQAGSLVLEVKPEAATGTITTIVGLISIFNGIGRVVCGGLYDKIGRGKTMILISGILLSASLVLIFSIVSSSFTFLVAGFVVMGLGYGGLTPTNAAFVGDFYGRKNYSVNFSIITMNLLPASFGSAIAGKLYDVSGSYLTTIIFILLIVSVGSMSNFLVRKP